MPVEDRMGRSGAAVGDEHALARIVALLDRRLADQVGHLRVDDPEDADRDLLGLHAEPLAERGERAQREVAVQAHASAEEALGV